MFFIPFSLNLEVVALVSNLFWKYIYLNVSNSFSFTLAFFSLSASNFMFNRLIKKRERERVCQVTSQNSRPEVFPYHGAQVQLRV